MIMDLLGIGESPPPVGEVTEESATIPTSAGATAYEDFESSSYEDDDAEDGHHCRNFHKPPPFVDGCHHCRREQEQYERNEIYNL